MQKKLWEILRKSKHYKKQYIAMCRLCYEKQFFLVLSCYVHMKKILKYKLQRYINSAWDNNLCAKRNFPAELFNDVIRRYFQCLVETRLYYYNVFYGPVLVLETTWLHVNSCWDPILWENPFSKNVA